MDYESKEDNAVELKDTVAEQRKYRVLNVEEARKATTAWLENVVLAEAVSFGLPEVDDRYHVWRVPSERIMCLC